LALRLKLKREAEIKARDGVSMVFCVYVSVSIDLDVLSVCLYGVLSDDFGLAV
jgi:hypothetical protein